MVERLVRIIFWLFGCSIVLWLGLKSLCFLTIRRHHSG
jgi:hypothetical protein